MSRDELDVLAWPLERVGDAVRALAHRAALAPRAVDVPRVVPPIAVDEKWLDGAVGRFAEWVGVEAEPTETSYGSLESLLSNGGPLLIALGAPAPRALLAIVSGRRGSIRVLGPDGLVRRISTEVVASAVRAPLDAPREQQVQAVLDRIQVPQPQREKARRALLGEWLASRPIAGTWMLRLSASAPMRQRLAQSDVPRTAVRLVFARLLESALIVSAWYALGVGALAGNIDRGWLIAWALLLLSAVPVRAWSVRAEGRVGVRLGALVKSRLLVGALRLDSEETRKEGAGQLMGRVLESQTVEQLAIGAGIASALAVVELVVAGVVLAFGAAPSFEVLLLVVAVLVVLALGVRLYRWMEAWSEARVALTHDTIERLVGHRTRLVQEHPRDRHALEDPSVVRIVERARRMDRISLAASWVVPRGWLVASVLVLAPALVAGGQGSASVAVTIGGALLAFGALRRLTNGVSGLVGARIAWERVGPLFEAATRSDEPQSPRVGLERPKREPGDDHALLEARDLVFGYADRAEPVLRGASLSVGATDRILLEGPSGGGKSTFGSLIAGLRDADAGLVLLDGLDRKTLGSSTWRSRVASAPQFHENHVLSSTLAFNLLMGRRWPPRSEDLAEAEAICQELDLGPLLARMPAGMQQMVGETGWQLSHGERSRVYVARALLQHASLVVLDESFAALDPATLRRAIECVERRAKAVLVVAHP